MERRQKPGSSNTTKTALVAPRAVRVFLSYAHEDEGIRTKLDKQLAPLRRSGKISSWHDRQIVPGADFKEEIDRHLASSDLVLLLISADFLASDFCYGREMHCAIARHLDGLARVVPIILRPCAWQDTPIGRFLALPTDGRPVTVWHSRDGAFLDVAKGILRVVEELSTGSARIPGLTVRPERPVMPLRRRI
jgi:hypothetical protein